MDLSPLWTVTDDSEFVLKAYRLILGREPEMEGHLAYLRQLHFLTPREAVAAALIDSEESLALGLGFEGLREAPAPPAGVGGRMLRLIRLLWRHALWPARRAALVGAAKSGSGDRS